MFTWRYLTVVEIHFCPADVESKSLPSQHYSEKIKYRKKETPGKGFEFDALAEVGIIYTSIASNNSFGLHFEMQGYYSKRFSIGGNIGGTERRSNNKFSCPIPNPYISYAYVGLINQFEFLQKKNFIMNFNLTNGFAQFTLGKGALSLSNFVQNNYYLLEPGLSISICFFGEYLTLKSKYRFVFGKTDFGTKNQFENFNFSICYTWR